MPVNDRTVTLPVRNSVLKAPSSTSSARPGNAGDQFAARSQNDRLGPIHETFAACAEPRPAIASAAASVVRVYGAEPRLLSMPGAPWRVPRNASSNRGDGVRSMVASPKSSNPNRFAKEKPFAYGPEATVGSVPLPVRYRIETPRLGRVRSRAIARSNLIS